MELPTETTTNTSDLTYTLLVGADQFHIFIVIKNAMQKVCIPLILIFGTFGNVMTIIILCRIGIKHNSMNLFFITLALSDMCLLNSGFLRACVAYMTNLTVDIFKSHVIVCKMGVWAMYTFGVLSAWLLVVMTAQRAASVVWPHRIKMICTQKRSYIFLWGLILTVFCIHSHILYGYVLVKGRNGTVVNCAEDTEYRPFMLQVWSIVDMCISSLVPFCILAISNAVLVWKLTVSVRQARIKLATSRTERGSDRQTKATSVTRTLVILSAAFLLLTLPFTAVIVYDVYFVRSEYYEDKNFLAMLSLLYVMGNLLYYTNSAVNFYLYCLTGARFRNEFLRLICSFREQANKSGPMSYAHSSQITSMSVRSAAHRDNSTEADDEF